MNYIPDLQFKPASAGNQVSLIVLMTVISAVIFIVDLLTPLGIAVGIGYVFVVLLGYFTKGNHILIFFSILSIALVIAGYFLSPTGIDVHKAILSNRVISVCSIVIAAVLTVFYKKLFHEHQSNASLLQSILTSANESVFVIDESGKINYNNKCALEMFGYEKGELNGKIIETLVPDSMKEKHVKLRQEYTKKPEARVMGPSIDLKAKHKDGSEFPVEISLGSFRNEEGLFVTCFVMDITDRKKVEEELRAKNLELSDTVNMLNLVNSDLEQFVYASSHEMQEPLRMVYSHLQALKKEIDPVLNDDQKEKLMYVIDEEARMMDLIRGVREYINVDKEAEGEEEAEMADTAELVNYAKSILANEIRENNAIIKADDLPTVKCIKSQLVLLFKELIENAIKYRSDKTPEIIITASELAQEWEFQVKDNGICLDPKYQDKIFMIFKKLHSYYEYNGPGVGLAIAKKIVKLHGGRIWYYSEEGKGTTFCFTIRK